MSKVSGIEHTLSVHRLQTSHNCLHVYVSRFRWSNRSCSQCSSLNNNVVKFFNVNSLLCRTGGFHSQQLSISYPPCAPSTSLLQNTQHSRHQRHTELRTSKTHTNRILVDYTYQDYERISSSRPLQATSIPYFTTPSRRTEQPTHTTRSHRNQSTSNL
jgi:hypothetical protein